MSTETTRRWTKLLPQDRLIELANEITAELVMTPAAKLLSVSPNELVGEVRQKLQDVGYDQAPIKDDDQFTGLIFTDQLDAHEDSLRVGEINFEPITETNTIGVETPVGELFAHFANRSSFLVLDENSDIAGLIHLSDLNKQAVRTFLYLWITAVEMGLAELVEAHYGASSDEWVDHLSDYKQMQILGRYTFSKRKNIEISYVEGVDLSDLVKVFRKDDALRRRYDDDMSGTQWDDRTGSLVELRHHVMHPVRTLVRSNEDAKDLESDFQTLETVISTLHNIL